MFRLPGAYDLKAARFFESLASLLDAGLTPAAALEQPGLRNFFPAAGAEAAASLRAGGSLTNAFVILQFDEKTCLRIEAAETSGRIANALRRLAQERTRRAKLIQTAAGKLVYPIFLIHFAAFVRGLIVTIGSTSANGVLAALSLAIPIDAVLILIGILVYKSTRGGLVTDFALRIPGARSVLRDVWLAPFLWTLADLYESGVPLDSAVSRSAGGAAPVFTNEMNSVSAAVRSGKPLVPAIGATPFVDETTLTILQPAEITGTLTNGLLRSAELVEDRLAKSLTIASRAPGTILYIAAILIVASMVFKFYSERFQLPG
ncbi:MAG: type II secretion system F family protein [Planctomycetota bacterium]